MKIYLGCDHKGVDVIEKIKNALETEGYEVIGTVLKNNAGDDYPDFAYEVCQNVLKDKALGILLCGTGIGMSIAANKIKGIRCAKVSSEEEAILARSHNGANVIALSYNQDFNKIMMEIKNFLNTDSANEERHLRRIEKINKIENETYN